LNTISSKLISSSYCQNPRNRHAYDIYEVERLDDNILGGSKQKE